MREGRTIKIKNGEQFVDYKIYRCDLCGSDIGESDPYYKGNDNIFCVECAFKQSLVSEEFYLNYGLGIYVDNFHAALNPITKDIEIWEGKNKTAPWEMTNKDIRNSKEYIEWRNKVFKRDNWTCQMCGKRGVMLNAHHIKPFAKYKELRMVVENGITLCEKCHKKAHGRL